MKIETVSHPAPPPPKDVVITLSELEASMLEGFMQTAFAEVCNYQYAWPTAYAIFLKLREVNYEGRNAR